MPILRQQLAAEIARGIKSFVSLEAGVVRGEIPDPERDLQQALGKIRQQNQQLGHLRKRLQKLKAERHQRLKQLREKATNQGQTIKMFREAAINQGWSMKMLRAQLVTDRHEVLRLQNLVNTLQAQNRKDREQSGQRSELVSGSNGQASTDASAAALYLDLIKKSLKHAIYDEIQMDGMVWPSAAHTMIGFESLDNLQFCIEDTLANDIPGDFIETGVWRGGASILVRAVLEAHGVKDRLVWVADSFEGLPPPNAEKYPHDASSKAHTAPELAVSLEQVQANFQRYGLLDDQVRFLKGWFSDTLPDAPIEKLAVARLDGDMYESTMDALTSLYPKVSVGGYLIVDDYGAVPACRQAVHDYRETHGIDEEIVSIDRTGVYWRRVE